MTRSSRIRAATAPLALTIALLMVGPAFALPFPALPPVPTHVDAGAPFTPVATVYQEDFEFSDGGYTAGGTAEWEYGAATAPPVPVAGQGPGMWATDLDGDYEVNTCAWLDSAPIDLSGYPAAPGTGVSAARLAFRHWMHFEQRWDGGAVFASNDGGANWQMITPVGGYTHTMLTSARNCLGLEVDQLAWSTSSTAPAEDAWNLAEFDVTPFLGGSVQFRWMMASDGSVVKRGWYVDDVVVQVGAGASASADLPAVGGPEAGGVPFTPVTNVYAEDFEVSDGGWTADGTMAWEWGAPVAPPVSPTGTLNMWGTRLLSDYAENECSALTSPVISLPGADASVAGQVTMLSFKMWQYLENGYDAAHLEASTDGGATWMRLNPEGGYDRTITSSFAAATRTCLGIGTTDYVWSGPSSAPKDDEFQTVQVDVTRLMGSDVQFRFVMGSDADTNRRGLYVDDVIVQVGAGATVNLDPDAGAAIPNPLWTVGGTNPSWQFGMPTSGPTSVTPVWATNLAGDYNSNECSWIASREIDTTTIPGLGRLELTFQHAFDSYSTLDGGVIQVSADGGATWNVVTPIGGYGSTLSTNARNCIYGGSTPSPGYAGSEATSWTDVRASLASYDGDSIMIRYIFGSSASGEEFGWHIRNAALTKGAGNVPLTASSVDGLADLLAKADDGLRDAIERGNVDGVRVIVTGPAHEGVAELDFETRDEYVAWFDAKGAPVVDALSKATTAAGGEVLASWTMLPGIAARVDLPTLIALGASPEAAQITLDRDDAVKLIDPIPDDSVDASNTQGRQQLQAEDIWALGYKGAGIKVTGIDTGVDATHEAFKFADGSSRITAFADCVDGTCDDTAAPYDDHGHGTHTIATAAGSSLYDDPTHGFFQETGVAPEAIISVAKFLSSSGGGSFAGAIDSINWAFTTVQADLTTNSWGASGCSSSAHGIMQLVRTTTDAGMLNVFAAGNSGPGSGTIGSPGCSESALTIGAIDVNKNIASFSSRGPCTDTEVGSPSRICPDIVAKGVAVRSAIPRSGAGNADPSGYKTWQGTSMATPHAAGAVILAEQMKRGLTGSGWDTAARAEEEVFKLTAEDLGAAGEDNVFGWGLPQLLNIYALLDATDEARIVSTFGISAPVVRQGDTTMLSFGVRNLGGALVDGTFLATLTGPDGAVTTIKSSSPSLGLLDGESASMTFAVTGSVLPGTYTFDGSFAYTWTNSTSGEVVSDLVSHSGTFDVKRVFVAVEMDGLDASTTPADLQTITYSATNAGNEDANGVTIEFTVPDDYVFVPTAGFDPANPNSRYASPAPTRVVEDSNFGRVTLVFEVGDLAQGDEFSFTTQLLPTLPGTYRFLSVARWMDGGGNGFAQGSAMTQVVGLPA